MTYKEAFDKVTYAYINDKLLPYESCACFIGNLLGGNGMWANFRVYKEKGKSWFYRGPWVDEQFSGYTLKEIVKLENTFLKELEKGLTIERDPMCLRFYYLTDQEERLFKAMVKTLDVLKEIHKSKGEDIEKVAKLQKRVLV